MAICMGSEKFRYGLAPCLFLWALFNTFVVHATPATPPARSDVALQGDLILSVQKPGQDECQSACKAQSGCIGYTVHIRGYANEIPKANCSLFATVQGERFTQGAVSCRMPCTPPLSLPTTIGEISRTGVVVSQRVPVTKPPIIPTTATVLPVTPTVIGSYTPPPSNQSSTRTGIQGHEVVTGSWVTIPPLSFTTTSAQCPAGKTALSAGYEMIAEGDAIYGSEMHSAFPDQREARVNLRNSNIFAEVRGRAIAICAIPPIGLRSVTIQDPNSKQPICGIGERLIGGGIKSDPDYPQGYWTSANGPWRIDTNTTTWQGYRVFTNPYSPINRHADAGIALCAPAHMADGWEFVETPVVILGSRARTELNLSCPAGKVLLASGFLQHASNDLDVISNQLIPSTQSVTATLLNRNILNVNHVNTSLSAICANRQ